MAQIYIIGNEATSFTLTGYAYTYITLPSSNLDDSEIHDFLIDSLQGDVRCVVMDASVQRARMLTISKHIRLSLESLGTNALCPIIFLTELSPRSFMLPLNEADDVDILQTDGVYISCFSELQTILEYCKPIAIEQYKNRFLHRIHVKPDDEFSDHLLANQWGARVMYRLTAGGDIDEQACPELEKVKKKLFLKYVMASTTDVNTLVFQGMVAGHLAEKHISCFGRRILYIDDCAESGWKDTLKVFFKGADFEYINKEVMSFEDFAEEEQDKILNENWDLYLLDLRLGGHKEEEIYNTEEFSGMKVLKRIKEHNRGNQVIMFTASNKAWNFKALLNPDAGANGYYIKESPVLKLPVHFSQMNLSTFISDVSNCFERGYLKDFYNLIKDIREHVSNLKCKTYTHQYIKLFEEMLLQLEIAFNMADIANTPNMHKYAFIALEQAFEIISSCLSEEKKGKDPYMAVGTEGMRNVSKLIRGEGYISRILTDDEVEIVKADEEKRLKENPKYVPYIQTGVPERLKSIYLQLCKQKDDGILYILHNIITIRNNFIHPVNTRSVGRVLDKYSLLEHPAFNDDGLIFTTDEFFSIFEEMAKLKLVYLKGEMINIKNSVVDYPVGVKLVLATLSRLYQVIKDLSLCKI